LAAKIDDARIADTEILFRLVPALPSTARRNQQTKIIEITSSVFHTSALSGLRLSQIDFLTAKAADQSLNRTAKPDYGIAVFSAEFVRHSLGCVVCIEDEAEYPPNSHVSIYGAVDGRPLTGRQHKILTLSAHLALPPNIP
jgi:hypothetical protein